MQALVGQVTLLNTGSQLEKECPLQLLDFVPQPSASRFEMKGKAERLLAEIEARLPAQFVYSAQSRGQGATLVGIVE